MCGSTNEPHPLAPTRDASSHGVHETAVHDLIDATSFDAVAEHHESIASVIRVLLLLLMYLETTAHVFSRLHPF